MEEEISIVEVKDFSPEILESIQQLTKQLDENFEPLSQDDLKNMISSSNIHLYVARLNRNNSIVGMVTLVVYRIPYKMKAQVEDIVVDSSMRGKGLGKKLMQFVIGKAKEYGVKSLNLTSNPKRETANNLYSNLGFEKRDTNVYRLSL